MIIAYLVLAGILWFATESVPAAIFVPAFLIAIPRIAAHGYVQYRIYKINKENAERLRRKGL